MIVINILLILINLILWIIFGIKFKKMFSTDEIIDETRKSLNALLINIDRDTEKNMDLIDDRIAQLKAVSAEAERKVQFLKKQLDKEQKSQVFQKKLSEANVTAASPGLFDDIVENAESKPSEKPVGKNRVKDKDDREIEFMKKIQEADKALAKAQNSGVPEFFVSPDPIKIKKTFNAQVKEFSKLGMTAEQIATETGRSVQEVKLAMQLS